MIKKRIAVIGTASSTLSKEQKKLAFDVGRIVIESDSRLINGGMGGVMEHSSRGARAAFNYQNGDISGVLPSYKASDANPYIDIPLPTGLGVARNAVLMASCDAVIALDGGSGTLSEIALAWQMKKPIACIGEGGWHERLLTLTLDERRQDVIEVLNGPAEVTTFIEGLDGDNPSYEGIGKNKWSFSAISSYLTNNVPDIEVSGDLSLLGKGSEGVVVKDNACVYKVFYPSDYKILLYSNLSALANELTLQQSAQSPLPSFGVFKGELLVVRYPYFSSQPYKTGEQLLFISFLKKIKALGWCLSNVKADNFRVADTGELICIDIGRDIVPFTPSMFYSTCKRAFLTTLFSEHPDVKQFYSYTNDHDDFELMANDPGVSYSNEYLVNEFSTFYEAVMNEA